MTRSASQDSAACSIANHRSRWKTVQSSPDSSLLRMKFFALSHHGKNQLQPFLPGLRLFRRLKAVDNRIDVRFIQGPEKRFRFLVFAQFLEEILWHAGISGRSIGGGPSAISLCGFDGFHSGRGHRPSLGEALDMLGVYLRPSALGTSR